jgi:hypothetical protein
MSNIILYCFAGRRFRHELKRMIRAWINAIRKRIPCYCRIEWGQPNQSSRNHDEQYIAQSELSTKPSKNVPSQNEQRHEYVKLRVLTYPTSVL